jgi:hypothetical protein
VFPGGKLDPQDLQVDPSLLDLSPQRLQAALGEPGLDGPIAAGLYLAALRETSILFATLISALILRERVGPGRVAAVGVIACGAAVLRLA